MKLYDEKYPMSRRVQPPTPRKFDKYGRRTTDRQCIMCHEVKSIFSFHMCSVDICHSCVGLAIKEYVKPHYPVPATRVYVCLETGRVYSRDRTHTLFIDQLDAP